MSRKTRRCLYGQRKKSRTMTISDDGWERLSAIGRAMGGISRSELLERFARGWVSVDAYNAAIKDQEI